MKLQSTLIFMLIFINTIPAQTNPNENLYEGDSCTVDSSTQGVCKNIIQCPIVQQQLPMKIRPALCGFEGFTPIVCCPKTKSNLLNVTRSTRVVGELASENCKSKYSVCILAAYGGTNTIIGQFKSMTAIGWPFVNGSGYAWNCGGSLISEDYVLTAGHCTSTSDARLRTDYPTIVRMGNVNLKENSPFELDVAIVKIILHPQYKAPSKYNDIALLKLAKQIDIGIAHKPACLMQTNDFNNLELNALGWGKTGFSESSDILQEVTLTIVDKQTCNAGYRNRRNLPNGIIDSQICAGANGTQDTCQGDSGGPLLFNDGCSEHIIGVTSFGIGCGRVRVPGVYTRVSSYIDWIERIVWA